MVPVMLMRPASGWMGSTMIFWLVASKAPSTVPKPAAPMLMPGCSRPWVSVKLTVPVGRKSRPIVSSMLSTPLCTRPLMFRKRAFRLTAPIANTRDLDTPIALSSAASAGSP